MCERRLLRCVTLRGPARPPRDVIDDCAEIRRANSCRAALDVRAYVSQVRVSLKNSASMMDLDEWLSFARDVGFIDEVRARDLVRPPNHALVCPGVPATEGDHALPVEQDAIF